MKYTPAQCEARRQRNKRLGKSAPESYWVATPEQLAEVCNGIGTEKFGDLVIGVTTWILEAYLGDADIHDWCWTRENDGSVFLFHKWNNMFRDNLRITSNNLKIFCGWFRREARRLFCEVGDGMAAVVDSKAIGWPVWASAATIEPGPEALAP